MARRRGAPRGRAPDAAGRDAGRPARRRRRVAPPLEHRILMTATLCLLAFGAVMVYSASSPLGVLCAAAAAAPASSSATWCSAAIGLAAHAGARAPRPGAARPAAGDRCCCWARSRCSLLVLVPGFGVAGQRRPALVLGRADPVPALGADEARAGPLRRPLPGRSPQADARASARRWRRSRWSPAPACLLIVVEPDLGTTIVVAFTMAALLIAAGMPMRYVAALAGVVVVCVVCCWCRAAVPARAADLVPAPLGDGHQGRRRLPGGPGADRARLGRAARRRAGPLGAEDLLPARGADRLHPGGDRRGARRARDLRRGRASTG